MNNKNNNNTPDEHEASIFAEAMKDVRPLDQPNKVQHRSKPAPIMFESNHVEAEPAFADSESLPEIGVEDSLFYNAGGLQQSQVKKLKRGQFRIEATLDMHGMTKQQANLALGIFLNDSQQNGYRCVNVIHGKGYRSNENKGVLKSAVNYWLRQHEEVVAFASAPPKDGGTGAVNILLRRI